MHIDKALRLKVGDIVHCPADRGDPAFTGRVTHVSPVIHEASLTEFIWVEVQGPHHKSVWPSNRLG
jgi:hypothetical protein